MSEEQESTLKLAILLPAEFAEEVQESIRKSQPEVVQKSSPADVADFVSGFDPVSQGEFIWLGLKFVGTVAGGVALNLLSEYIWERIGPWREARNLKTFELVIRFPSGEIFRVTSTSEEELERLKATLARHQASQP